MEYRYANEQWISGKCIDLRGPRRGKLACACADV